ncbi:MAG: efflux RND transporter periplasmic adaptor subunit [Candidatus Marinimicrobia bacterium]|nr:efflux RND transporter periplasmic adaptor subunit [Candidatus Neomarinimicrobiota bacterium]
MNSTIDEYMNKIKNILAITWIKMSLVLLLGVLIGNFMFSSTPIDVVESHTDHAGKTTWTCSMHPQVKLDEPGQCPICFMDLIPLNDNVGADNPNQYSLSESAIELARISTSSVRLGTARGNLRLSGKIDYDETRTKYISAWFPGRLERLFVDYTGIQVNEGDHLFEIYSPELYSAQEELLQAYRRMNSRGADVADSPEKAAFQAVREKTKLLGLSDSQITAILKTGKALSVLQINSPITGIVIHKNAVAGKYVKTGEQIYSIADLSKVWIILEAYEMDLPWLTYGQELNFSVAGLPGQNFSATISYIDPLVNPIKRSITVRAVLDNEKGLLKPGMLTEATVSVTLNAKGQVVSPQLAGKWTCPMHPEELSNHPGDCSICGMRLVPMGKIHATMVSASPALLIPASAVLKTGKRALVYVEVSHAEMTTYELREVILGPRVEKDYIIISGLSEGELVVTNGNFKIDSAMQIAGKQSMMSAPEANMSHHVSAEFQTALEPIFEEYLRLQASLAGDNFESSKSAMAKLLRSIDSFQEGSVHEWIALKTELDRNLSGETTQLTVKNVRDSFEYVSDFIIGIQRAFGHSQESMLYEVFCPMAFNNKGASWLQTDKQVKNPYFGASMLSCGEIKQSFSPVSH